MKLLGSDPDKLFTFKNLEDELKKCGNYAMMLAPLTIGIPQADSSEERDLSEMFDNAAGKEKGNIDLFNGLSGEGQYEYDRRINELFTDIVRLGYNQTKIF